MEEETNIKRNIAIVAKMREQYEKDRERLLKTAKPSDLYEIVLKYELCEWADVHSFGGTGYDYIFRCLSRVENPLEKLADIILNAEDNLWGWFYETIYDHFRWLEDYGEEQ